MKKISKSKKRELKKKAKLRRKLLKRKKSEESKKRPKAWEPVKLQMFEIPNPFKESVTLEQRKAVIKEIGETANKKFNEEYPKIANWFEDYDAVYLLSFCAMYFTASPEGIDPEATGQLDFPFHFLELLQAFSLVKQRKATLKPLLGNAEKLKNEMRDIGDVMMLRHLKVLDNLKDEELERYFLRFQMMGQTTAVRNWAYYYQIKRTVIDLCKLIDNDFKKVYGVKSTVVFESLFQLVESRADLLNEHLDKVRSFYRKNSYKSVIDAFNKAFPENSAIEGDDVEEIWEQSGKKLTELKGMMVAHSDLKLEKIYSFTVDDLKEIVDDDVDIDLLLRIIDNLAYRFGDLKDHNLDFMVLDNPVHHKPFIKTDENTYFSALWGVFSHFALDILEDLVSVDASLRKKYFDKIKSDYLEDKVKDIFEKNFIDAKVFKGALWDGNENDLLIVIEPFAIVVEDKARLVSSAARRGAPLDLPETLKRLIEEPSEQSLSFIDFLKAQKGEIELVNKKQEKLSFDTQKVKYYLPLGVTFHHLGTIGSNLKKLIRSGIVEKNLEELAPSISFTDLEIVLSLLPLQAQKIHYLARRREFEAHVFYEGDELDLLGFYFDNGFNIGDMEYSRDLHLDISLKSKELDPYVIGTAEGRKLARPKLEMTSWWHDLLHRIDERKMDGWLETSFVLLNASKEDQETFESMYKELVKKVYEGETEQPHNWVMLLAGPERRRFAIAGYPYLIQDRETRNNIMSQAINEDSVQKAKGAVVIGVNLKQLDYPYSVLAARMETELLDILTLEES